MGESVTETKTLGKLAREAYLDVAFDSFGNSGQALYLLGDFEEAIKQFGLEPTVKAFRRALRPKIEENLETKAKELHEMVVHVGGEIQRTYLRSRQYPWDEHYQARYGHARDFVEHQLEKYRNGESIYVWVTNPLHASGLTGAYFLRLRDVEDQLKEKLESELGIAGMEFKKRVK
jgi:hypothetical protein